MGFKELTFDDDLPMPSVTINTEYTYSFTPGKYFGAPEDCYPDDEESEIVPVKGYEDVILAAYAVAARQAIKHIDSEIKRLEDEFYPRQWSHDDTQSAADDRAADMFESRGDYEN